MGIECQPHPGCNTSFVTLGLTFVKVFLESLFPLTIDQCQHFGDCQSMKANK